MANGTCAECGSPLPPRGKRGPVATYCSAACRRAADKVIQQAKRDRRRATPRPCERCGEPFAGDIRRRYCSADCRRAAATVAVAARKAAQAARDGVRRSLWRTMIARCYDPGRSDYPGYGGRGITVCDRWRGSFEAFAADVVAEIGPRPPGRTLDRVDNDGGYGPGKVRWSTPVEQGRNRRGNRYVTAQGRRLTVSEWAEVTGLAQQTIRSRLRLGWPDEATVSPRRRR